jgi:predicted glutamine amidotransferase
MCRFSIYFDKNNKINIFNFLFNYSHSISRQTYLHSYTPHLEKNLLNCCQNLDGYGMGWLFDNYFYLYKNTNNIINNDNLKSFTKCIKSNLIFAHIKSIMNKTISPVCSQNCYPFHINDILFQHNGCVTNFNIKKKIMIDFIDLDILTKITGSTDSELLFGIILKYIKRGFDLSVTVLMLFKFLKKNDISGFFNIAISNKTQVIVSRANINEDSEPLSLYYRDNIISSEPLDYDNNWKVVPKNSIVIWNKKMEFLSID